VVLHWAITPGPVSLDIHTWRHGLVWPPIAITGRPERSAILIRWVSVDGLPCCSMPSQRVQRRIGKLLDQAEEAADNRDWSVVAESARMVLQLDPDNEDAIAFQGMVDQSDVGSRLGTSPTPSDSAASTPADPDTPMSFAGNRYIVKRFLGEGGKKKVYLAHDSTLDRDIAFAVIKTDGLDDIGRERIQREAQAMGRMGTHPCIMPIYDFGEEDGTPYMVQPLMGGGDVEELIGRADGPLPLDQALRIANETAQGLAFAHSRGIVHRDLKPGNVWLDDEGAAKIGDFGLAIATDRSRLTVEKLIVGTVNYMPPEQAIGGEVTPRADLYSLGAMLYEMCTGRVPFIGDDDIAVISQHVNTPPVAARWHNPKIPRTLDSLIMRLLSKDPHERPRSADEVLAALEGVDLTAIQGASDDKHDPLDSIAGGVFVGRQRETDHLRSVFEDVLSGKGRMVMLAGEPGIGKTRIAQEIARYASMRGAAILWGRSYESGGAPPYWPWVQLIRSYVSVTDPDVLRRQMGSTASIIAEVVPEVRDKLPDVAEPSREDDPGSARFRLFDSIATFLRQAASDTPLVLMLEDLHWSDKPSLMLLEFVAREIAHSKILIVGNYRDAELNRRHPLSITLGDLTRDRLFERLPLRGLGKHDVGRFIELATAITPPPALVEAVYAQTEGNPLFVTETVRLLIQEGDITAGRSISGGETSWQIRIPEGVREVIGRRLERLTERCNEVLTIAAVIGRQFRFDLLTQLVEDTTEVQLLDALEESLSARIVEELPEEAGFYQFTHASMQETLADELSAGRRSRLHARIVGAIEELHGDRLDEYSGELALHCEAATGLVGSDKLTRYSQMAGRRAMSSYAYEEGRSYFELAVSTQAAGLSDGEMADLWFELGEAYSYTWQPRKAIASLTRAFELYMTTDNVPKAIHTASTGMGAGIGDAPEQVEFYERGLALATPGSREAGVILNEYASALEKQDGDYPGAVAAAREAIAIAEHVGDQLLHAMALHHLGRSQYDNSELEDSLASNLAAIDLLTRIDPDSFTGSDVGFSPWRVTNTLFNSQRAAARALRGLARPSEAINYLERSRITAGHNPDTRTKSDMLYFNALCLAATFEGRWEEAAKFAQRFDEVAWPTTSDFHLLVELMTGDQRSVTAEPLEPLSFPSEESNWIWFSMGRAVIIAEAALVLRDVDAMTRCEEWANAVRARSFPQVFNLTATGILALVAVGRGDEAGAETTYAALRPFAGLLHDELGPGSPDRILGLLARVLRRDDDADRHFEASIAQARLTGSRPWVAWIGAEYAECLTGRNVSIDREKATGLQDEAITIATELGMQPLLERVLAQREMLKA